jgi:hypothetical protein
MPNSRAYIKAAKLPNSTNVITVPNKTPRSASRRPCFISSSINGTGAKRIMKGAASAKYIPPVNITRLKSIHDNHSNIILDFTFQPPQRQ